MEIELKRLNLKCQGCGATLEVAPEMERISCGYCRTDHVVSRSRGTAPPSLINDSTAKTQVGTDKATAESPTSRLRRDLSSATRKYQDSLERENKSHEFNMSSFPSLLGLIIVVGIILALSGLIVVGLSASLIPAAIFYADRSLKKHLHQNVIVKLEDDYKKLSALISDQLDEKLKEVPDQMATAQSTAQKGPESARVSANIV